MMRKWPVAFGDFDFRCWPPLTSSSDIAGATCCSGRFRVVQSACWQLLQRLLCSDAVVGGISRQEPYQPPC